MYQYKRTHDLAIHPNIATNFPSPKDVVETLTSYEGKEVLLIYDKKAGNLKNVLAWCTSYKWTIVPGRFAFFSIKRIPQSISAYQVLFRLRKDSTWPRKCYMRLILRSSISSPKTRRHYQVTLSFKCLTTSQDSNVPNKKVHNYEFFPTRLIENQTRRRISKHDIVFSRRTLISIMFNLVELVEKRITLEPRNTKCDLMYDVWTSVSTHYIVIFASYMVPSVNPVGFQEETNMLPKLTFVRLSSWSKNNEESSDIAAEATQFHAEVHGHYFREIFEFCSIDSDEWTQCLIADSYSKPNVGYANYLLDHEVRHIVKEQHDLDNEVSPVHESMRSMKRNLKKRTIYS